MTENNDIKNENNGANPFYIFISVITIAVLACLFTYIRKTVIEDTDASFHYSNEIHINFDSRKTSLERWHQALIDSVYLSTPWDCQNFHTSAFVNIDSVHVDYLLELDSLSLCFSKIDQIYKEYYNHALNDLRQESNNIITKWSAWLGFWISVLALLMGILPIVLQFKLVSRSENRLKEEMAKISNLYYENKKDLEAQYENQEKKLKDKSRIIDDNIKRLDLGRVKSKIINEINAIDLGKNNKLLKDSSDRELLLWTLLKDLRKQFCEFIKANIKADVCTKEDKYIDMLIVLIEIHGIITKLIPFLLHKGKSRKIQILQRDLQILILKIASDYSCVDNKEFDEIQRKFCQLVDEFK